MLCQSFEEEEIKRVKLVWNIPS